MSAVLQKEKTSTSNGVTSEQSTKLIQTMLSMSFGCIAYLRGLFPDELFANQRFVPEKFEPDFDAKHADSSDAIRVKTLLKGKNPSVDLLLNWIDKGCVDSLRLGYLKSLSFAIFLDENDPTNLYEVYTFHFDYADNSVKVGVNENVEDSISLLDSRRLLQQLMKRFIIITQSLSPLPQEKFISIRLLFNDNCPKQYQPPLFRDASNDPTATVRCSKSHLERYIAGNLSTGHHDINMGVMASTDARSESSVCEDILEVDPFVAPKLLAQSKSHNRKMRDFAKPQTRASTRSNTLDQSQTTSNLKSFLNQKSQNSNIATQKLNDIECECGTTHELEDNTLYTCSICSKKKHSSCYGFKAQRSPSQITCYSCRSQTLGLPLHENLQLLMGARKVFNYLMNNLIPSTISELFYNIGFSDQNKNLTTACEAISFLIINNAIFVTDDPFYKVVSESLVPGSYSVKIDMPGIRGMDGEFSVLKDHYGVQFVPLFKPTFRFEEIRKACSLTKKLLFEVTQTKCFTIDCELDRICLSPSMKLEGGDETIDSSRPSSPIDSFSALQIAVKTAHTSDDLPPTNISSISSMKNSKKRGIDGGGQASVKAESLAVDTMNTVDYLTSQPVCLFPRANKKRKTSVTENIIHRASRYTHR